MHGEQAVLVPHSLGGASCMLMPSWRSGQRHMPPDSRHRAWHVCSTRVTALVCRCASGRCTWARVRRAASRVPRAVQAPGICNAMPAHALKNMCRLWHSKCPLGLSRSDCGTANSNVQHGPGASTRFSARFDSGHSLSIHRASALPKHSCSIAPDCGRHHAGW